MKLLSRSLFALLVGYLCRPESSDAPEDVASADRMEQLTEENRKLREMIVTIAHDLRTPLTIVQAYLETIQVKGDQLSPERRKQLVTVASSEARSLGRFIETVFELSMLHKAEYRIHREPFSLTEVAHNAVSNFSIAAEDCGIAITVLGGDRHLFVDADILLVERVLNNLIDNALRHARGADAVTLELIEHVADVEVRVRDNGSGLPPETSARLETDSAGTLSARETTDQGHGLGLSIVRRILELHGRSLDLVDVSSPGTCFRFFLRKAHGFGAGASEDAVSPERIAERRESVAGPVGHGTA